MKTWIGICSAVLALTTTSVFAADALNNQNPALLGTWRADAMDVGNGIQIMIELGFSPSAVTAANTCTMGANSVRVSVSGTYNASMTDITVTSSANDSRNFGGLECNVQLQPATLNYSIAGNDMTLTIPGQGSLVLHRVQ